MFRQFMKQTAGANYLQIAPLGPRSLLLAVSRRQPQCGGSPHLPTFLCRGRSEAGGLPACRDGPRRGSGGQGSRFGRVPRVRPTQGCVCSGDISAASPCPCSPCRAPLCSLTHLSEKPPAFRGAQPRPFLAPGPPNDQAYPPYRQDLVVSTVPLSGGHSPDELEINSTDPFPDSIVHLGLIEDEKKKSRQRRPKPL